MFSDFTKNIADKIFEKARNQTPRIIEFIVTDERFERFMNLKFFEEHLELEIRFIVFAVYL